MGVQLIIMKHSLPQRQTGLSLVELMVAMTIGLLILLGLGTLYVQNNRTQMEIERNSRQIENGRYALQLLVEDIRLAGYLGESHAITPASTLPTDPCSSTLSDLLAGVTVHVQGFNNDDGDLSCVTDYRGGDVIVVRRAATCTSANPTEVGCPGIIASTPYLQTSSCSADTTPFLLDSDTANLTLRPVNCSGTANIRRFLTHIYYIANNNIGSDGIPTLKRWELGGSNNPVPLAEGIENLQFEYGIDNDNNGTPDEYKATPANLGEWLNTMAVKVHLLSRNESASPGHTDGKTYNLGGQALGPFNDAFRRHVYSSTAILYNPSGRRQ
jgi:type IV pilus assembly protein PilW